MLNTENPRFYGLIAIIFIFLCCGTSISAATFTVTKTTDTNDGVCNTDCSLREAVAAANAAVSNDSIEFDAGVFGTNSQTITLSGTQLQIDNNGTLTINGPGANLLIISGNQLSSVFRIEPNANATLNSLTIANGKLTNFGSGAGIANQLGNLTVNNSVITNNTTGADGEGGGIYNCGGGITINNSTISNNSAGGNGGGGIATGDSCVSGRTTSLTITNSTFSNNTTTENGGAIDSRSVTNITNTTFNNNSARFGGAVILDSTTNMTNVYFMNNTAAQNGGAIFGGGRVTIAGASLTHNTANNYGGAISLGDNSNTTINDSYFANNTATNRGGAFYNFRGTVNLNRSSVNMNHSIDGGAIYNDSLSNTLTVFSSWLHGNTADKNGGAINNAGGTVALTNSSIDSNSATALGGEGGGAIYNSVATLNVINSTLYYNSTNNQGGGIFNRGTVNLTNATIAANQSINGGGIFNFSFWTVNARNTIVGDNTSQNGSNPDYSGTLNSLGYNLIENPTGAAIAGTTTGNILRQDPQLLYPFSSTSPTATLAMLPTSPVIDAADPFNFPATDQRGIMRPQDGDDNGTALADIGAYEREISRLTVTKTADTNDGVCSQNDCSLREALAVSNAVGLDKVIKFDPAFFATAQTINLTLGELLISNGSGTLLIQGTGADLLTISANNLSSVITNDNLSVAALQNLTITDGFANNGLIPGGGILNKGTLSINKIVVKNSTTNTSGGGIYNNGSRLFINNSTIKNNHAPGEGGGIYNSISSGIAISNSTVSGNSANLNGGGISNSGTIAATNTTVSNNTANQRGGGIYNTSPLIGFTLSSATITDNTASRGGGIYSGGTLIEAQNTIIGNNTATEAGAAPDFGGTLYSQGYNLIENTNGLTITNTTTGNILGVDPQLLPLGNYGGTTQTHALRPTSPAIDKGGNFSISTDQRGKERPFDNPLIPNAAGGNGSDIGAFERQSQDTPTGTAFDFDGDAKTDISIFRPGAGEWWINRSFSGQTVAAQFGLSTDVPVPADFTGDGKTDIAFFRPSTGEWFILRSENGSFLSFPFGTMSDVPLVGDFDADGKADPGVFRPSTGEWFISRSSGDTIITTFGAAGDKPVVADYDGDGKADIAIFRPSDGSWWYLRSSDGGFRVFRFGAGTDKPVQGDYTGDGKADIAVFRPATGEWFFQRSEDNSYYSVPFGTNGDLPTPGDYDGDGKFDTAVFRPATAGWYVQRSTAGILIINFGTGGDRPIPNAFVP